MHKLLGKLCNIKSAWKSHVSKVQAKLTKEDYLQAVEKFVHIQGSDIYEINFCQEYFAEEANLNPIATFNDLHAISEPPFACYYRYEDCHLMSASPERFLKK